MTTVHLNTDGTTDLNLQLKGTIASQIFRMIAERQEFRRHSLTLLNCSYETAERVEDWRLLTFLSIRSRS